MDGSPSPTPHSLEDLGREIEELRASRERLVLEGDAERGRIERELHDGLQQQLVALSVAVQHASARAESEPSAVSALLDEIARDVQATLDEAARLAERIHVPLLEHGRLAAALRAAAVSAGVPASVEVAAGSSCPPEVARTVLLCWLEALERSETGARPAISVREDDGLLAFEIVSAAGLDRMRDRVEALGGRLNVERVPGGGARVSGSLPLSRGD